MEPWLKDDPSKPKIFALAGFFPIPGVSAQEMKLQKDQIIQKLVSLGGRYMDRDEWDPSVTHVISYVDGKKDGMSEKVMAGIAAGRWVLTKRYVEKSFKAKEWIQAPRLFAPSDAVIRNRRRWFLQGARGGPFWNMKAALVMEDERKRGVYGRIIVAGGGSVREEQTLRQLAGDQTPLSDGQLTHVFMDPWAVTTDSFRDLKSKVDKKGLQVWFLHYKYLFLKIRGSPEPTEVEHSVMNPQVREIGERERRQMGGQRGEQRNKRRMGGERGNIRKKQKSADDAEIVLVDSDDDCVTIVDEGDKAVKKDDKNHRNTDISIDIEDDDDIRVLEQKLASSRAEAGSGRQYMERGKATGQMQSYKEMCEQQRREQLGTRRKSGVVGNGGRSGRQTQQNGVKNRRGSQAGSVQVISLSDDEAEMVTIDDSDDEVRCVDTSSPPSSSARVPPHPSLVLRSPSPVLMQLDQDEREDSGDESETPAINIQSQVEAAPEVFDIDSDDDLEAIPVVPAPTERVSPCFSSDDIESAPESPGVEQSHESSDDCHVVNIPSTKEDTRNKDVRGSRVFEETVEPSLDFYEDRITEEETSKSDSKSSEVPATESEAELIRRAIFDLADEEDVAIVPGNTRGNSRSEVTKEPAIMKHVEKNGTAVSQSLPSLKLFPSSDKLPVKQVSTPSKKVSQPVTDETPKPVKPLKFSEQVDPEPMDLVDDANAVDPTIKSKPKVPEQVPKPKELETTAVVATPLVAPSSPVPIISQTVTKSTLLHRIIATIIKRMTFTDEGIAISNINSRTARFDKHGERRKREELAVKQVHHNVEMDFSQYFKTELDKETVKVSKKKKVTVEDDFRDDDGITSNDSVAIIRRLKIETTSTAFPTSSLLNTVMKKLMLEEKDHEVMVKAYDYLDHFLFLHLGKEGIEREQWLVLVLSAMRNLPEQKLFKSFDIGNSHDIQSCFRFFGEAVAHFQAVARAEENDAAMEGPQIFFEFLVKLLQKDFELWWKHWRKSELSSNRVVSYPLLYFMLGGSRSSVVKNLSRTVLQLYSLCFGQAQEQMLPTMRKLVAMSALLVSHLDSMDDFIGIYTGDKVTLAKNVGEVLQAAQNLSAEHLYMELSMLQPNWLSLLVSRHIISQEKVDIGESLAGLEKLKLEEKDKTFTMTVDNWSHRLCGFQQAHAIFRANWHYVRSSDTQFKDFKHMSRLEERGVNVHNKMVKLEDVGVRLSKVVESVNTFRDSANNNSGHEEKSGGMSVLSALFFQMTFVDNF